MSVTKEYLESLDSEVGIAPASSQEELDCAQYLAGVFSSHGIDPQIQDFTAPSFGYLPYGVVMVLLFAGVVLAGLGQVATLAVGIILVLASVALLVMTYKGKDVISKASPRSHSQNVVALHKAEGEGNSRNRPIVIVAHYDTQRLDLLSRPELAVVKKYLAVAAPYTVCVTALCVFVQLLGFLPEAARRTFWVIGIIAALPMLLWGIALIASRFLPYAAGGVDNKSSLAAMLGVLDRVNPVAGRPAAPSESKPDEAEEDGVPVRDSAVRPARREPAMRREVEEVIGACHGETILRELGILPEDCDITYIEPEVRLVPVDEPDIEEGLDRITDPSATSDLPLTPADEATDVVQSDVEAAHVAHTEVDDDAAVDPGATAPMEAVAEEADPDATRPMPVLDDAPRIDAAEVSLDPATLNQLEDGESVSEGPTVENDQSGITNMAEESDEDAAEATRPERPRPSVVEDPEWGHSTYVPKAHPAAGNVARRAALFDLPDPLAKENDPFAPSAETAPAATYVAPATVRLDDDTDATQFVPANQAASRPVADDIQVLSAPVESHQEQPARKKRLGGLFGKKRRQQQESMSEWLGVDEDYDAKASGEGIGSWDNFNDDNLEHHGGGYKGGAALNVNLRGLKDKIPSLRPGDVTEEAEQPSDEEVPLDDAAGLDAIPGENPVAEAPQEPENANDSYEPEAYDHEAPMPEVPAETIEAINETNVDRKLRDAILAMSDDDLRAHDIWFVATGASALGHAGIKDFIAKNRKSLRGAFVINLECVGAGDLTLLTNEGLGAPRRADRRLARLISSVASDLHLDLGQLSRTWADTEATPLMRSHLRAVTLMGLGDNELPAFAHTADDVPENVNPEQVENVCALIMETIRRS